jgi:hypothetical protein
MTVGQEFQLVVDDAVDQDDDIDNSSAAIALLGFSAFAAADDTVIDDGDDSGTLNDARESIWSIRFHFFFDSLGNDKEDVVDEESAAAADFFFRCSDVMSRAGRL